MLRFHFTEADLTSVVLAPSASPMWEVLLSLHSAQSSYADPVFGSWRRRLRTTGGSPHLRLLLDVAPAYGYSPDFVTPELGGGVLDDALDVVGSTDVDRVHRELGVVASRSPARARLQPLADRPRSALAMLLDAVRTYWAAALEPTWSGIQSRVGVDLERRRQVLATDGVGALLESVGPGVRWRAPVLEVDGLKDVDVHLDGRGLVLQPSYFCWRDPTKLRDPEGRPVLVYPVEHDAAVLDPAGRGRGGAVGRLVGQARHDLLQVAQQPATTSELAERCVMSVSNASRHASALREAGLLVSQRDGQCVRHQTTALGRALLHGAA